MPNREEKKRRQAIVEEIRREEKAKAEVKMPISKPDLKALFQYVEVRFREYGCDNTLKFTIEFLSHQQLSEDTIIGWLIDEGGGCDCEIMCNVEETWGEVVGYSPDVL